MALNKYFKGREDCIAGNPCVSTDMEYLRGYGETYHLQECITAHYLMEPIHKELNAMEIEIELMMRAIV